MRRTTHKSIISSSRRHVLFCVSMSAHARERTSINKRQARLQIAISLPPRGSRPFRRRPNVHLAHPCDDISQHSEIMMGHIARDVCIQSVRCPQQPNNTHKKKPARFTPNARNMQILRQSIGSAMRVLCAVWAQSVFMHMHKCKMTFTKFSHSRPLHLRPLRPHVERYVFIVPVSQPANVPMHLMRGVRKLPERNEIFHVAVMRYAGARIVTHVRHTSARPPLGAGTAHLPVRSAVHHAPRPLFANIMLVGKFFFDV